METLEKPAPPKRIDTLLSQNKPTGAPHPPLPPRTSSNNLPFSSSIISGQQQSFSNGFATLPRNRQHHQQIKQQQVHSSRTTRIELARPESSSSSSSSSSSASPPTSTSPVNPTNNNNIAELNLPNTPPPMPLIPTSPHSQPKLIRRVLPFSQSHQTSLTLGANSSLFPTATKTSQTMLNLGLLSTTKTIGTSGGTHGLNDIDSMLNNLNKQLEELLDSNNSSK